MVEIFSNTVSSFSVICSYFHAPFSVYHLVCINSSIRTRMISGPVGTSGDIASKSGFFAIVLNTQEAKKVPARWLL